MTDNNISVGKNFSFSLDKYPWGVYNKDTPAGYVILENGYLLKRRDLNGRKKFLRML